MLGPSHPVLAFILEYWTMTIFVPAILTLVTVLALVTRRWDRRDESARKPDPRTERHDAPRGTRPCRHRDQRLCRYRGPVGVTGR